MRNELVRWAGFGALLVVLVVGALHSGFAQERPVNPAGAGAATETPEFHLGRAHEALKYNRYQEAVNEFRTALALDPTLVVRARFPLAVALFSVQEREQARQEFEKVRAQTGDDPNIAYYLGRLDLMEGNLDSAIKNLTLAAGDPPFPDTAYYLGYAFFKKGDYGAAEKWLRKAAELSPQDFRVYERLGLLYRAMGRKEEAEKALAVSTELHKSDVEATQVALECSRALDTRPLEEARAVCDKLNDPHDLSKLVTLGNIYGEHGRYEEALEPFRQAARLDPESYEMQYNLGLTLFRLKRYAEARAPLEKATQLRPDMFEMNAPLGAVLFMLGDDLAAYPVLDRAHQLAPENADMIELLFKAAVSLAAQNVNKKEYAAALPYMIKAAELQPADAGVHRRLAELYSLTGDETKAAQEREQAERLAAGR
jgi:tetratricopeptide (TPR) repeat protein